MLDTIYIVQHSHTDLGFTGDQPIVDSLHGRFLRQALEYAERFADAPPGERFCWTVETCGFLENWLPNQSARTLAQLRCAEAAGLIEICALPDHTTPLSDLADYHASLCLAKTLRRDHGFRLNVAMNCDVNGQNWPFADALLDAGIAGYTTAINVHSGRTPFARPTAFRWRAPSGRLLPVYHGPAYGYTGKMGISPGTDIAVLRDIWLPRMERHLADNGYGLSCILLQSIHPFGDNGPPDPDLLEYVRRWNATGHRLRLHLGTPGDWWRAVQPQLDRLPIHAGDWTDSWVYGAGSAARELAYQRATRPRLRAAGTLLVAARAIVATKGAAIAARCQHLTGPQTTPEPVRATAPALAPAAPGGYVGSPASRLAPVDPTDLAEAALALQAAASAQLRYQEHTWTADCACEHPHGDDAFTQSAHKRTLAASARSLATLAHRDALAVLARHVARRAPDDLLVFNPLPFARTLTGLVGGSHAFPRGRRDDPTAGRHYQDRKLDYPLIELADRPLNAWKQNPEFWLSPVEVPALGYRVVSRADACLDPFSGVTDSDDVVVETPRYRLTFDLVRGGLVSLVHNGRELVDASASYPFGSYVHERVAPVASAHLRGALYEMDWNATELEPPLGWKPGYAAERLGPTRVLSHRVRRSPLGVIVIQTLEAPGAVGAIEQSVWLPAHIDWIEFTTRWVAPCDVAPQANYVVFPFSLPGATPRYDIGSQAIRPGPDQLPGVGCDYFCAQNWVDFSTADFGVTIAVPENPLFMLGGFNFARCATKHPVGTAPHLVGFVANNFWETNYPVTQPGEIVARYRLRVHEGDFDETAAHRFGLDAAYRQPALQHLGECPADGERLPSLGSLLELTAHHGMPTSVQLLCFQPHDHATATLLLHNASDEPAGLRVNSGVLKIVGVMLDAPTETEIVVAQDHGFFVTLPPRRTLRFRLTLGT